MIIDQVRMHLKTQSSFCKRTRKDVLSMLQKWDLNTANKTLNPKIFIHIQHVAQVV